MDYVHNSVYKSFFMAFSDFWLWITVSLSRTEIILYPFFYKNLVILHRRDFGDNKRPHLKGAAHNSFLIFRKFS